MLCIGALAACGGSTTTLGAVNVPSGEASATTSPSITVTVVLDLDLSGAITRALGNSNKRGLCKLVFTTVLDGTGGRSVTLKVAGVDEPFTARLRPSPRNGADLPCQAEAMIPGVPSGASSYVAKQTGPGGGNALSGKATVTGKELEANSNVINLG